MKNNYELIPLSSVIDFENLVAGFDCDHEGINDFLLKQAPKFEEERRLTTFLLVDNSSKKVVAFYSTTVGELTSEIKEDDGMEAEVHKYLNLAYFAVDRRYHRRGLGTSLIRELFKSATLVSCYVGIEMLYLESVDEAVSFYRSVGFQLVKPNLTPEKYHAELQDTTNINFDMFITIEDLFKKGYVPPERNVVPVLLSEKD